MALEKYLLPNEEDSDKNNIALHLLIAVISEVRNGAKTQADAKTALEEYIEETFSDDAATDLSALFTYIEDGTSPFDKADRSDEIYRVCSLAAHGTWYGTQALLKTRLGFL